MSVNKWRLWAPKASALSHPTSHSLFSFFSLSSLLFFLSLFFFICSSLCSSLEQKAHTHWTLTPVTHTPTTHTPTHADPSWEIISFNLRSHAEKLHHALILLIATIVLVLQSGRSIGIGIHSNDGSPLETIGNDSIWKLILRSRSSMVGVGNSSVESSFLIWKLFFFSFFFHGVS